MSDNISKAKKSFAENLHEACTGRKLKEAGPGAHLKAAGFNAKKAIGPMSGGLKHFAKHAGVAAKQVGKAGVALVKKHPKTAAVIGGAAALGGAYHLGKKNAKPERPQYGHEFHGG